MCVFNGFEVMTDVYNLELPLANGKILPLKDLKGQVVLVVNIASECGYAPQMAQLQQLKEEFKYAPFQIIAVPSNDFAGQEPLDNQAIQEYCDLRFRATFPIAEKSQVKKGNNQHPLYRFLSDKQINRITNLAPVWNFHKYLIDKQGNLRSWYFPFTAPTSKRLISRIKSLLEEK